MEDNNTQISKLLAEVEELKNKMDHINDGILILMQQLDELCDKTHMENQIIEIQKFRLN